MVRSMYLCSNDFTLPLAILDMAQCLLTHKSFYLAHFMCTSWSSRMCIIDYQEKEKKDSFFFFFLELKILEEFAF